MTDLLVLDDARIAAMITDARIRKLLPCLATLEQAVKTKNCLKCRKKLSAAETARANAMLNAKRCLAGTRGDVLATLKKLLDARQLRVYATDGAGRVIKWTL